MSDLNDVKKKMVYSVNTTMCSKRNIHDFFYKKSHKMSSLIHFYLRKGPYYLDKIFDI